MRECSPPKTCHVSHVTCLMPRVPCHVSHVTCHNFFLLLFFRTKWWSLSVEGMSSTGLPRLVLMTITHDIDIMVQSPLQLYGRHASSLKAWTPAVPKTVPRVEENPNRQSLNYWPRTSLPTVLHQWFFIRSGRDFHQLGPLGRVGLVVPMSVC